MAFTVEPRLARIVTRLDLDEPDVQSSVAIGVEA
jgi:hypothetical protein